MQNDGKLTARSTQLSPARQALLEKWRQGKSGGLDSVAPRQTSDPAPLSFQQYRLWFLHQLEPDVSTYTMSTMIQFTGELHIQALEESLTLLAQRHEPLRTCFPVSQGQPAQYVLPPMPLHLALLDLGSLPEKVRQDAMPLLLKRLARHPVSLATGPLFRYALLRLSPQQHVLMLTMHHTIYDGLSLNILLRELAVLYRASLAHGSPALPPLPLGYTDYATWQRERLQGQYLESLVSYWREQLRGASTLLELPTDRPRQAVQTHNGARLRVPLAAPLVSRLTGLSKQEGVTLFMLTLAAFQILLARYSGQRDFLLGTPVANRPRPEFEALIGFFANTLVLRALLSGNPTFRSFLQQTRKTALQAYAHQELPFEQLVEVLQPPRSLSYNPLVQVVFSLDEVTIPPQEIAGVQMDFIFGDSGLAQFDLTVSLIKLHSEMEINAQYNTDLFDEATIPGLIQRYLHLLESIVENPEQRIHELPLLLEKEFEQAVRGWNDTYASYPDERCLHALIEEQAEHTPDALAVVLDECALSYGELLKRAEQLASYLNTLGVGPDCVVGLCLSRSLETMIALLGILKAGGAYLPLDPTYPAERLNYLLADSQVTLILTQRGLPDQLDTSMARIIHLENDWPDIARSSAGTRNRVWPDNLAYVIYTSGSTGRPKGVAVPHRGICNLVSALRRTFTIAPGERVLQFASMNFDASVLESFSALAHGACLVLASREALLPGQPLADTLQRQAITVTLLPPSTLAVLAAQTDFPALRVLITGGEACAAQLIAAWASGREFFNAYGPTEASVCATIARCRDGSQPPPLGKPLSNSQLYILDAALQPVPPGVCGEIYLGGVGLARGYLGRPDLTAERFVPHPFSSQGGARLYRTGDLACYDTRGNITFLGRTDDQVKLRGFRVEPGEIETMLLEMPVIRDAAVVVHSDQQGEKQLVAYLAVPRSERNLDALALRQFLRTRLPEYMIPARFVFLDALPATPNGKLDRRALPGLGGDQAREQQAYVAPQNTLEQTISATWQEVLQVARVGRNANFFDLGGHSLAMVRVHTQLQARLKRDIALLDLFQYPTVEALAHYLNEGASVQLFQESQVRASVRKTTLRRQQAFQHTRKQEVQESERLPHA